jgi:putative oxidoreductase
MNSLNRFADTVYCIMRLIVGLMFACHGAQKVLGWFTPPNAPPHHLNTLMTIGGWIELVCGLLIALGLLTRIAAFIASGEMAAAFFMMHASGGTVIPIVNKGELAVVYCWLFLFIVLYGAGAISLDTMLFKKSATATSPAS